MLVVSLTEAHRPHVWVAGWPQPTFVCRSRVSFLVIHWGARLLAVDGRPALSVLVGEVWSEAEGGEDRGEVQ